MVIRDLFDLYGGNSGLTESVIYYNPPVTKKRTVSVYSGATMGTALLGYIDCKSKINGRQLKIFNGPAIILVRKGLAGKTKYIKNGFFTINDDAYVLTVKEKYKNIINIEWLEKVLYNYAEKCITSKGTNGTFSKEEFLNLEFSYPCIEEQIKIVDYCNEIDWLKDEIFEIKDKILKIKDSIIIDDIVMEKEVEKLFEIRGGNAGLTEEFIYNNQPMDEKDSVVVYSASTDEKTKMGVVSKNSKIKNKIIKCYDGPAAIISRNGQAGKTIYIESGEFTINDHAYVITVKNDYKKIIDLEWFVDVSLMYTRNCVTSKDSNGTFSKEIFKKEIISIIDYSKQKKIVKKKKELMFLEKKLTDLLNLIEYEGDKN